jgi:hypothetical protein
MRAARWDIEGLTMANYTSETDLEQSARCLYEAEVALHAAHRVAVDAWIAAAADGLPEAVLVLG